MRSQVRLGHDPLCEREKAKQASLKKAEDAKTTETRQAYTLDRAFSDYTASRAFKNDIAQSSQHRYLSAFNLHIAPSLGKLPITDIRPREVIRFVDSLSDGVANLVLCVLKSIEQQALDNEHIEQLFIPKITRRVIGKRNRLIDDLPAFLNWLDTPMNRSYKAALMFQLLTGLRASEAYALEWAEIGEDVVTVPHSRVKNRRKALKQTHPLLVPLLPKITDVLNEMKGFSETYVFPQVSKDKPVSNAIIAALLRKEGFNLSSHDLRKTVASRLNSECNASLGDIDHVLDHAIAGVNSHYLFGENLQRKRRILSTWHEYLSSQAGENITPLKTAVG